MLNSHLELYYLIKKCFNNIAKTFFCVNFIFSKKSTIYNLDYNMEEEMVFVTKLSGEKILINHSLIESAATRPDTTLTMTSGKTIIIEESLEELSQKIINYKKIIQQDTDVIKSED